MILDTPTTKEISRNIVAQLEASLNQSIPLLPKSFLRVLAKVLSGVFILLYKYGGFIFLQMFVQTASIKDTSILGVTVNPLKFWGRLIGIGDPISATNAELLIEVTVETQVGVLPSGSQLIRPDTGVTYLTTGAVALNTATVQVIARAASDQVNGGGSGVIGNLEPGDVLSFANPLPNVGRNALVVSQVTTGANAESADAYRQRISDRFQKRPQGGAYADYEQWGEEAAGVINVYPYTSDCPGQIDVFCEATVASSGSPDGIPTTAQIQSVLDLINFNQNGLATRRPANALVNGFPIDRLGFDVRVLGLLVDNLAQVRADITAAVEEYFLAREPYIVGLAVPPRRDQITQSAVAGLVEDVVSASGGIFSGVVLSRNSTPVVVYVLGVGEKSKALSVSFV